MESLGRLQGLFQDLSAFSETRLANIDRLWAQLEVSIEDFRKLLDKSPKNNTSRECLATGKLKVEDREYQINEAFQQGALQVADTLDLDEVEAAKLLLEVQPEGQPLAQSPLFTVVTTFHDRREVLLQTLRLIFRESQELDNDDDGQQMQMQDVVRRILDIKDGPKKNGSAFAGRCITAMRDIEDWQIRLSEQAQKATVLGLSQGPEALAVLEIQRISLSKQHEAVGTCLCYLFKGDYTRVHDLRRLLDAVKRYERIDMAVIHYLPAFSTGFAQYGSSDRFESLDEAHSLHKTIAADALKASSISLQPFQAVLRLWWICEYSSCYREGMVSAVHRGADHEAEERAQLAKTALDDGALTLLLSVCTTMADDRRYHPARHELTTLLLSDGNHSALEGEPPSSYFRLLFMERLESFSESWITNMPDSIRQLKSEEDDTRLQHITAMQDGISVNLQRDFDIRLHLECFLVLISFAFEHRPDAAEAFWVEPEGNLFGFLHWASKRQTVPRVSAFCEMLCAISSGQYTDHGHQFLLDDSSSSPVKPRKSPSMNYAQIFAELELYASKVNEKSNPTRKAPNIRKILPTDMNELESPVMLSCYLRLIAHICKESSAARGFILGQSHFNLVQTVLTLCSGPVPTYLRASVFTSLESLLVAKLNAQGCWIWSMFDAWATDDLPPPTPNVPNSSQISRQPLQSLRQRLDTVAASFDQYSAFTSLLRSLIIPASDQDLHHILPFPGDLGVTYRVPGIEPYLDLVCGTLFAKKLPELPDETQTRVFRFHCLDLMATALETFNESLVAIVTQSRLLNSADSLVTDYVQRHPFSRVMEWLFNDDVVRGLLAALCVEVDFMETLPPDAIDVANVSRCLDIFIAAFEMQPTYLEIVRPLVRKSGRSPAVAGSSISTIEDIVVGHPSIVSDLAKYAGSHHEPIVLRSLGLLQKLSSSTRLNPSSLTASGKLSKRRLVDMLGYGTNLDVVSLAISLRMKTDFRELEAGPGCSGYNIKDGVLTFLITCLTTQYGLPEIAHLFLGFTRVGESLLLGADNSLEDGASLCMAIIQLVEEYPDGEDNTYVSWLMHIKTSALHVLRQLWTSPLSCAILVSELRRIQFLSSQFAQQAPISAESRWDGRLLSDPMFWLESSADALAEFLGYRNFLYEYAATEMRSAVHSKSISLQTQVLSTLRGTSANSITGETISHASIVDLFDIVNIDIDCNFDVPELTTLSAAHLQSCIQATTDGSKAYYDVQAVEELIQLSFYQAFQKSESDKSKDEERMRAEADVLLDFVKASNQWTLVRMARIQGLRMWVEVVILTIQYWPLDLDSRTQFALSVMQLITPKIDAFLVEQIEEATELLRLADALVGSLASLEASSLQGRTGKVVTARQLQLFQTSVDAIPAPSTTPTLRGLFYSICAQYLGQVKRLTGSSLDARRYSFKCVKSAGVALVNVLSDDAENGQEQYRLSAFVLLTLLTDIARQEKSTFVIDSLVKTNTLEVLLDSVRAIPIDLQEADNEDRPILIRVLHARFALLLEISRSRGGAGHLLDVGLQQAIRDSGLCRVDPDLGLDVDMSMALQKYYELLALALRLLVSVFLSRGPENLQSQHQMRTFLTESRTNIVGAFKRHRGLSGETPLESRRSLEDVVKSYAALISMADFIEFEEASFPKQLPRSGFS